MIIWDDVVVRARGLATHLPTPADIRLMARAGDIRSLNQQLDRFGLGTADPVLKNLEAHVGRWLDKKIQILLRWAGDRRGIVLSALLEDFERRAVRALLRGAMERAPSHQRIAGLSPTPLLERLALEQLGQCEGAREVATTLVKLRHPYGPSLLPLTRGVRPDPLDIDIQIDQLYAHRATQAARKGDSFLRRHVARTIDASNIVAALTLAGRDLEHEGYFLSEGRALDRPSFESAVSSRDTQRAWKLLESSTGRDPVLLEAMRDATARKIQASDEPAAAFRRTFAQSEMRHAEAKSRHGPLSTAPIADFILRAYATIRNIYRLLWGMSLNAPAAAIESGLVLP